MDPILRFNEALTPSDFQDIEAVLEDYFHLCFLAGPARCRFWSSTETEMKSNFWALDSRIHTAPLPISPLEPLALFMDSPSSGVLDWSTWPVSVNLLLYTPLAHFPLLDRLVAQVYNISQDLPMAGDADVNATASSSPLDPGFLPDPKTGRKNGRENRRVITCMDRPSCDLTKNMTALAEYL